jgi:hypothetical protein
MLKRFTTTANGLRDFINDLKSMVISKAILEI